MKKVKLWEQNFELIKKFSSIKNLRVNTTAILQRLLDRNSNSEENLEHRNVFLIMKTMVNILSSTPTTTHI